MRCKIVKFQKLMWRNMKRPTKSKKTSVLHYSINYPKSIDPVYNFKILLYFILK